MLKGIGRQPRRHGSRLVESTRLSTRESDSLSRLVGRLIVTTNNNDSNIVFL